MRKLIVKTRLLDLNRFYEQLAGIGTEMSPVIWQHERVYLPHNYQAERNLPRLVMRTEVKQTNQPAQYSMYLKRHIEDSGVDWVNYTSVGDYVEASGIIHQLGFKKTAEISRQRQEMWLDDQTVVYVDTVEGIEGSFLKIEAILNEEDSVEALRKDLFAILKLLGLTTFTMQSYFELLHGAVEEFLIPE